MSAVETQDVEEVLIPLEIKIPDITIQSGTVPVSWCVSPELLKSLAEYGNHDPQIVIVAATANRNRYHLTKESRQVSSLKSGLTYLEFRSSGENNVWAFVPLKMKAKDVKNRYLSRSDGSYATTILDHNGEGWDYQLHKNPLFAHAPALKLLLPEGAFAKEPSDFEKNWVNWLFRTKCVDQCAFRRRRMFAYTLQVFPLILSMLMKVLATFGSAMIGSRKFSFKLLAEPLGYSWLDADEIFGDGTIFIKEIPDEENPFSGNFAGGSDALTWSNGISYIFRKFWALPFMPAAVLLEFAFIMGVIGSHFMLLWITLSVLGAILFGLGCYVAFAYYTDWQEAEQLKETPWYLKEEEMDFIMCSNPKKVRSIKDLPSNKRTLKLRFLDMKSRVCRPFSA